MGNFYSGFYFRPREPDEFERLLGEVDDSGFASQSIGGWTYMTTDQMELYPLDAPSPDTRRFLEASQVAIGVCNADDDAFGLVVFSAGHEKGRYVFDPAEMLELGKQSGWQGLDTVAELLGIDPVRLVSTGESDAIFAVERHATIGDVLELPPEMVGVSVHAITNGEFSDLTWRIVGKAPS